MNCEPRRPCEFSGLVLAGGRSTRMGRDKAFLRVGGERLLDRQLALLRALGARELFVSGRRGINYRVPSARVVLDRESDCGPAGGILAGLRVCRSRFLFVLAVDLPEMSRAFASELVQRVAGERGVVPRHARGYEALAAIFPRTVLAAWEPLVGGGECSMQNLVRVAVEAGQVSPWELSPEDDHALANWNCPSDWRESRGRPVMR